MFYCIKSLNECMGLIYPYLKGVFIENNFEWYAYDWLAQITTKTQHAFNDVHDFGKYSVKNFSPTLRCHYDAVIFFNILTTDTP